MGFLLCRSQANIHENFEIEEIKDKKIIEVGLKIYICGDLPEKDKVIKDLFTKNISDKRYRTKGTYEFKTEQFYWISKIYPGLSEQTINSICEEIKEDIDSNKDNEIQIEQNVILCFDSKNIKQLFEKIKETGNLYYPFIIIISEEKINSEDIEFSELRKITNIVLNDKTREKLNSLIISQLWEYDCYYNEKGNIICRYTPDNIFKTLDANLSFYSLNLLLTGKSRSGKSTFINYLTNKLSALESCKKTSVSQKITEYCIYLNNDNNERSMIKLFDTPGITPEEVKKNECQNFLTHFLRNEENDMEKQIHIILFFFMENDSLEGNDEIFNLLNNCEKPVLFIINKAFDESDDGQTKDINSTISFLKQRNCNNLIDKKNFFGINIVNSKKIKAFGVEDIFKRIHKIFTKENQLNEEMKNKIEELCKKYDNINDKPFEEQNKETEIDNLKEEVKALKNDLNSKSEMFKYLNINNIIKVGQKSANKCRKVINSLGNISDVFPSINNKIPAISFFQAFMVKEIGEIFGFDLNGMNNEINTYFKNMEDNLKKIDLDIYSNIKISKDKRIKLSNDIIEKQLKLELEKSNKEFITKLAEIFQDLRNNGILKKEQYSQKQIDKIITNGICHECKEYLINQLKNSQGVIFYKNYFKICKQLENDLKYFSKLNSEDAWGKKEMIIFEK